MPIGIMEYGGLNREKRYVIARGGGAAVEVVSRLDWLCPGSDLRRRFGMDYSEMHTDATDSSCSGKADVNG